MSNEQSVKSSATPFKSKSEDPGFLVVKGRFSGETEDERKRQEKVHIKKLARAIFMAMTNHGYATVRAVGRNATYNATKAIAITSGYCKPKGIDICFEVSFDEGNLGPIRDEKHVSTVTALVFTLKGFKQWQEKERDAEVPKETS